MSDYRVVHIVDDDPAVRSSLKWLLGSAGFPVTVWSSAEKFLGQSEIDEPGCIILDLRMPGMTGLELQERLNEEGISAPIIVITGYAEVKGAVRAMKAGAIDFIEKPFSDEELLDSVRKAFKEDAESRRQQSMIGNARKQLEELTKRELEVLSIVAQGKKNREVAEILGIREKTVEVHRANMMRKLGVHNTAGLVRLYLDAGVEES